MPQAVLLGLDLREASVSVVEVYIYLCMPLSPGWSSCLSGLSVIVHSVLFFHVKETYTEYSALALPKPSFCPMPVDQISAGTV